LETCVSFKRQCGNITFSISLDGPPMLSYESFGGIGKKIKRNVFHVHPIFFLQRPIIGGCLCACIVYRES
jgi:hypothetical protein